MSLCATTEYFASSHSFLHFSLFNHAITAFGKCTHAIWLNGYPPPNRAFISSINGLFPS